MYRMSIEPTVLEHSQFARLHDVIMPLLTMAFTRTRMRTSPAANSDAKESAAGRQNVELELDAPRGLHWFVLQGNLKRDDCYGRGLLLAGFAMLFVQTVMVSALFDTIGNQGGTCSGHGDCGRGKFCSPAPPEKSTVLLTAAGYTASGADLGTCLVCGQWLLDAPQTCRPNGSALESLWQSACSACTSPSGQFISDGYRYSSKYNLDSMSSRQWLTYFIVATIGVGVVSHEVRNTLKIVVYAAGGASLDSSDGDQKLNPLARRAILSEQFMRGVMVSLVVFNTPYIVLMDSIRVIDILLNAVAALLLLDLDEVWCFLLLPESMALRLGEERMLVSKRVASALARSEKAVAAATMLTFMSIGASGSSDDDFVRIWLFPSLMIGVFVVAICAVYVPALSSNTNNTRVTRCSELACCCIVGVAVASIVAMMANDEGISFLYVFRPDT